MKNLYCLDPSDINLKKTQTCILEFTYFPSNFPNITSYYFMNDEQLCKFKFDYKDLNYSPINNFFNSEQLNDTNSSYYVYSNSETEYYINLYNYIILAPVGTFCDLLGHYYKLLNNNDNYDNINIENKKNYNDDSMSSDDSLYRQSENIINVINLFNKNNLNEDTKIKIKNMIHENPNLVEDAEVNEINKLIAFN